MFAKERQDKIYSILQNDGAVTTSGLVELFQVSIETIRRDLLSMEQNGRLSRVHGGAVAVGDMKPFMELQIRSQKHFQQKYELSLKAAEFIENGDIIGIDAGSTAAAFANALKNKLERLTVVTHSLDVLDILRDFKDFSVILCGGCYLKGENAFYGALTLDTLSKLHLQKTFIFPSAVSIKHGICDYQGDLYMIQKQLLKCSDEIYVLADSSKFEKKALLKIDDMKSDYTYVTDSGLSRELTRLYKENQLTIITGGNENANSGYFG